MLFRKAGCYTKFMKPGLPSDMLFSDPATFNKITLAFLNASTVGVVKVSLSPQDFLVDISTWVCDDTSSQEHGGESLRNLDHDDEKERSRR